MSPTLFTSSQVKVKASYKLSEAMKKVKKVAGKLTVDSLSSLRQIPTSWIRRPDALQLWPAHVMHSHRPAAVKKVKVAKKVKAAKKPAAKKGESTLHLDTAFLAPCFSLKLPLMHGPAWSSSLLV